MGGQGECERRSEAFVRIKKNFFIFFFFGGGGGVGSWGGSGRVGGVRVDVNGEVKFCENSKKKKVAGGGGGGGGGGVGWVGGGGSGGVRSGVGVGM